MKDIVATIIIEIKNKTEQELLKNVDYSRRKNINKAMASKLYFEEASSESDFIQAHKIYYNVMVEGGSVALNYLEWMKYVNPSKNKTFVVKHESKIIGCFVLGEITRRFYNLDSDEKGVRPLVYACDKNYNDFRPNDFMYWNTVLYALKNNLSFVDLAGYQLKPRGHLVGVNSFKEKWGGQIFYYHINYPFFRAVGRKLVRRFDIFWSINTKLKELGFKKILYYPENWKDPAHENNKDE